MNHAETQWLHALYLTHAEPLYRLARARLGDPHEAQDLVQAVFLAAGQKAATLQTHPNPLGWLLQALQYELSHTFSKRARRVGREVPLDTLPPGQAAAPGPSLGLAEVLPTQLSPRDREILLLYYEEGLSYQEMADRLGIPLSTCGTRLARAKAHCKTYLTQPPQGGRRCPIGGTAMSHPSVARSLVLETTLFPEDVSLDRLQALLDQWEGDAPAAPFDPQTGWRAFRRAHPALFPRHPAGRALPWLAGAAAALAVALTGTDLLTPAPEEQGSSVSVSLDPQEAWRYAPLYDLLGVRTLGAALPLPPAELPLEGRLETGPTELPHQAQLEEGPYREPDPGMEEEITEFVIP